MPKITAIRAAVKTQGRVNIFVDGKYSFSLDESQLLASRMYVGREYSDTELENLKDESAFGKAYMRALDYVMRRPRSKKEMRDYAFRKKWERPLYERVITRLEEKGYLDDEKFADTWIQHRALGKPMSGRQLRLELQQKGIPGDAAEQAMSRSEEFSEINALKKLIAKKRARYVDKQKFIQYLMSKGYRYQDIQDALAEEYSE